MQGKLKGYSINLSHADSGKAREGWAADWEQGEKKEMILEKKRAKTNSEVKEGRHDWEKQMPLIEGRLCCLKCVHVLKI